eukprot:CAMPEP_0174349238 /NCGR_PEP_ID=MMETSP0811_2-20130205/5920_1 /TAXON_ID=73025 ORGANISM="Eutreptiella gymnastica-like, Strain CCMP1594" /NCGR_SAMPLE_ID=MMETSP0811_2 /ASSEMBLY_ACC=CAM_ASM_000667 /LENGTH=173 /DNA_ID=CAMNT_0015476477 /DNA_START=148 /DNA_END=670 /DNA_ORIENTATION=-
MSASFLKRTRNNAFPSEIVEDQNIERSLKARPVCNRTSADCQAEAQFQHCSFAYEVLTSCDLQGMQMKPILSMAAFLGVMCQSHTEAGLLCPTPNQNPDQSGFTISTSLWDQHAGDANCHASSNQYILKALEPQYYMHHIRSALIAKMDLPERFMASEELVIVAHPVAMCAGP